MSFFLLNCVPYFYSLYECMNSNEEVTFLPVCCCYTAMVRAVGEISTTQISCFASTQSSQQTSKASSSPTVDKAGFFSFHTKAVAPHSHWQIKAGVGTSGLPSASTLIPYKTHRILAVCRNSSHFLYKLAYILSLTNIYLV